MPDGEGKKFKCPDCQFSTDYSSNLVTHKRSHTGEKPFKCDLCNYATGDSSHLVTHKRTHTGEKPFKCDLCNYATGDSSALVKHKRTHTGEKLFKCTLCSYASAERFVLDEHMNIKHKEVESVDSDDLVESESESNLNGEEDKCKLISEEILRYLGEEGEGFDI